MTRPVPRVGGLKIRPGSDRGSGEERAGASLKGWWRGFKDFLFGFFIYGMVEEVAGRKREQEELFLLVTMGDLIGLPIFPPYYRLRFLPYCLGRLARWKKEVVKPKDLFSEVRD